MPCNEICTNLVFGPSDMPRELVPTVNVANLKSVWAIYQDIESRQPHLFQTYNREVSEMIVSGSSVRLRQKSECRANRISDRAESWPRPQ